METPDENKAEKVNPTLGNVRKQSRKMKPEQSKEKQTDAFGRAVQIPAGYERVSTGDKIKIGDSVWRAKFALFVPFSPSQIETFAGVLACEIVIRKTAGSCRVTIPTFCAGDFVLFLQKQSVGFRFGKADESYVEAFVETDEATLRNLLKLPGASFEFVTEFHA